MEPHCDVKTTRGADSHFGPVGIHTHAASYPQARQRLAPPRPGPALPDRPLRRWWERPLGPRAWCGFGARCVFTPRPSALHGVAPSQRSFQEGCQADEVRYACLHRCRPRGLRLRVAVTRHVDLSFVACSFNAVIQLLLSRQPHGRPIAHGRASLSSVPNGRTTNRFPSISPRLLRYFASCCPCTLFVPASRLRRQSRPPMCGALVLRNRHALQSGDRLRPCQLRKNRGCPRGSSDVPKARIDSASGLVERPQWGSAQSPP